MRVFCSNAGARQSRVRWWSFSAGLAVFLGAITASAQYVEIDPEFPKGGAPDSTVRTVAIERDGATLVGGYFTNIGGINQAYLARIKPDGNVDAGFAPVLSTYPANVLPLTNGSVIVSGNFTAVNGTNCPGGLARLLQNGALDLSFRPPTLPQNVQYTPTVSADGSIYVTGGFTNLGGYLGGSAIAKLRPDGSVNFSFHSPFNAGDSVTIRGIQSDGKLIVSGSFTNVAGSPANILVRLQTNGVVDTSYISGLATNERISRAVLQADDRLVVAVYPSISDYDFAYGPARLVRLGTNGAVEAGFALETESLGLPYSSGILSLSKQADESILVSGTFLRIGGVGRGRIARILSDGSLDHCFDVPFGADWVPLSVAAAPDGSVIAGGGTAWVGGELHTNLVRLLPKPCAPGVIQVGVPALVCRSDASSVMVPVVRQGGLDLEQTATFATLSGNGQSGTIHFLRGQRSQAIELAIAAQSFELVLTGAGGGATLGPNTNTVITVMASSSGPCGMPDTNYVVALDGPVHRAYVLPDGSAIINGFFTNVNGQFCPNVAKLLPDGGRDPFFNRTKRLPDEVGDMAVDSAGRVLLAGYFDRVDSFFAPGLARLKADGSVDETFAPLAAYGTNYYGPAEALALAVLDDGSIVCSANLPLAGYNYEVRLLKMSELGVIEPSFETDQAPTIYRIRPAPDGKLYSVGRYAGAFITRLHRDGSLDKSFLPPNDLQGFFYDSDAVVLPDGRVVVSDSLSSLGGLPANPRLWRQNPDGSQDTGFALRDYPGRGELSYVDAFEADPDGSVLVAGSFAQSSDVFLARFNADGAPDLNFDQGTGFSRVSTGSSGRAYTIKSLPQGGWLIGGEFGGYDRFNQKYLVKILSPGMPRPPSFRFASTNNIILTESGTNLTFEVLRRGDASLVGSVTLMTVAGTATVGEDYVALNTNLVFSAGEWAKTVTVTVLNDSVVESTESFTIVLTNASAGAAIEAPSKLTISIQNDDAAISFSESLYHACEEDGFAFVAVRWSGALSPGKSAMLEIRPLSGGDHIDPQTIPLTFSVGTPVGTNWLRIPIRDDGQAQDDRAYWLFLSGSDSVSPASPSSAILVLSDNDFSTAPARGVAGIVNAVVGSPGGGVYIVGEFNAVHGMQRKNVARLLADGEVDPGFDPELGPDGVVFAATVLGDGKLVIGGWFTNYNGTPRAGLARLNIDGSLDSSFDPGLGATATNTTAMISLLRETTNGSLVVAGSLTHFDGIYRPALARLDADGSVDTSFVSPFVTSSVWGPPFPPRPRAPVVIRSLISLPDGNLLTAGSLPTGLRPEPGLIRLRANGNIESTLYSGTAYSAALQDDKILVGLFWTSTSSSPIVRVSSNGAVDATFQVRNLPITPKSFLFSITVRQLAVQSDGRILGTFLRFSGRSILDEAVILRLLPDGEWDPTFAPLTCKFPLLGNSGTFWYNQPQASYETPPAAGVAFAHQSNGVLVLGGAFDVVNGEVRRRLARVETDGTLRGRLLLRLECGEGVSLGLPSEVEPPYVIETSCDMLHWTPWLLNQYPWRPFELTLDADEPCRFFRALPVP